MIIIIKRPTSRRKFFRNAGGNVEKRGTGARVGVEALQIYVQFRGGGRGSEFSRGILARAASNKPLERRRRADTSPKRIPGSERGGRWPGIAGVGDKHDRN